MPRRRRVVIVGSTPNSRAASRTPPSMTPPSMTPPSMTPPRRSLADSSPAARDDAMLEATARIRRVEATATTARIRRDILTATRRADSNIDALSTEREVLEHELRESQARLEQLERDLLTIAAARVVTMTTTGNDDNSAAITGGPQRTKSKQRRERRKRLNAHRRAVQAAPAVPTAEPTVKNSLGIISIRRKDCALLTAADMSYIKSYLATVQVDPKNISIFKNMLQIFCGSKVQLQAVWEIVRTVPSPPGDGHDGYHSVLPGIRFPSVELECRVPGHYTSHSKQELVKLFLDGCPGFTAAHVKCRKKPLRLNNVQNVNKKVVLFMDVSEMVVEYLRGRNWLMKLGKTRRVRWRHSKRALDQNNKQYKKCEDVEEYWGRKRRVSLGCVSRSLNSCYDYRHRAELI